VISDIVAMAVELPRTPRKRQERFSRSSRQFPFTASTPDGDQRTARGLNAAVLSLLKNGESADVGAGVKNRSRPFCQDFRSRLLKNPGVGRIMA